jgi:hypothetical protein
MTIKDIIDSIKKEVPVQVVVAKVDSVDKSAYACDLIVDGRPDRPEVRLRAVMDNEETGLILIPKAGSYVLVGLIENKPESSFICGYSELDQILMKIEAQTLEVTKDGFVFNSGELGGLTITPELKTQLDKMTARIDAAFNLLEQVPSGALHPNTGVWTPIYQGATAALQKESFDDIENDKVKH